MIILVFLIFTHLVLITTQKCAEIIILAYTGAEQESSILKSYKHMLNVPITPPMSPILGSGSKTYLNRGNNNLSPIQGYYIIKNTNRNENFDMFFLICIQNAKKYPQSVIYFLKGITEAYLKM